MTTHRLRLPRPGGEWQRDPHRNDLYHRNGNTWDQVRPPRRHHRCVAQSKLMWIVDAPGHPTAAVRWCACGGVTYPGTSSPGRWLGKNARRTFCGAALPAWHRAMPDLNGGPAIVFARPRDLSWLAQSAEHPEPGRTTVEATPSPPPPPVVRPAHPASAANAGTPDEPGWRRRVA
jgi:hypothetical protein